MDKKIFRDVTYGMYIVTTKDKNKHNVGCVINTLTQITSNDPIITISLNKDNYTNQALKENKLFAISIISTETPKEVIGTFGYQTSKDIDKFANIDYILTKDIPIIKENTCGYILANLIDSIECNTHDIIIAKVLETKKENDKEPMTYKYYHEKLKGTSPKNAPTYVSDEHHSSTSTSNKYKCKLCGYYMMTAKNLLSLKTYPMIGYALYAEHQKIN